MDTTSALLGGGGVLGLGMLASAWGRIKGFFQKIWGLVFITVQTDSWHMQRALRAHLWKNFHRSWISNRRYGMFRSFVKSEERSMYVGFEKLGQASMTFWQGWRPLFVSSKWSDEAKEKGEDGMTISFFRWTYDPDGVVQTAVDNYNSVLNRKKEEFVDGQSRFGIKWVVGDLLSKKFTQPGEDSGRNAEKRSTLYDDEVAIRDRRYLTWGAGDLGFSSSRGGSALDQLALEPEQEETVETMQHWLSSRAWYKSRSIPWKRGLLLTGPPGSGKTSLVRAFSEDLDLPVWIYDLATLTNRDFITNWRNMLAATPCVALIEDIDTVFHGRENITEVEGGLTFNCLLNAVDGVERTDGVVFVVTTNCREKLDPALSGATHKGVTSRPGRVDTVLEFGAMSEPCRQELAETILWDCTKEIPRLVEEGEGDVAEQFQERCRRVALDYYWQNREEKELELVRPEVRQDARHNGDVQGALQAERFREGSADEDTFNELASAPDTGSVQISGDESETPEDACAPGTVPEAKP